MVTPTLDGDLDEASSPQSRRVVSLAAPLLQSGAKSDIFRMLRNSSTPLDRAHPVSSPTKQATPVRCSTVKKSAPASTSMWDWMNSFRVVFRRRSGAGAMLCRRRRLPTVRSEMEWPRLANAPTIRSHPQPGFSRARRTTRASISAENLGRPGSVRRFDPSNFCATSLRYQARSASGLATRAISFRAWRPSRFAISAKVDRSALDRRKRDGRWALRIPFSASRYSLRSNNS
jgi:hypothetical protein